MLTFKFLEHIKDLTPLSLSYAFQSYYVVEKTASLPIGESVRGEVWSGSWIYHYVRAPKKTSSNFSLDFSVFAFEGAVDFSISESHPVIKF